jgi:1,4-dihydroxy-2-naphthoate octaprenyltransferase
LLAQLLFIQDWSVDYWLGNIYTPGKLFNFPTWMILTLGLFVTHGTNNLINDYTDFSRGIDVDGSTKAFQAASG